MKTDLTKNTKPNLGIIGLGRAFIKAKVSSVKTVKYLFAGLLACVVVSAYNLRKISTEYSYRQFYPQNHEILKIDKEVKKTFQLSERSPFLFLLKLDDTSSWIQPKNVKLLKHLTECLQNNIGVEQVISIMTVEGASQSKNEISIGNLFARTKPEKWEAAVRSNPLMYPLLISKDFKTVIFAVDSKYQSASRLKEFGQNIERIIKKQVPNAQVTSAGVPVMQGQLTQMIRSEVGVFFFVAIIIFCTIFYMLFSHWTAVVFAGISLLIVQIFSLGLLIPLGISLNVILSTLPIIVSVTMMSLLIHTLHLWAEKRPREGDFAMRWQASVNTATELVIPNFLGGLTTAFGFLALAPSEIPIIQQYGYVVAFVVFLISLFGQIVVLLGLPLVNPKMRPWFEKPAAWSLVPLKYPRLIFSATLVVAITSGFGVWKLNFSGRLFDDLPEKNQSRVATQYLDKHNGGLVTYDLVLSHKQEGYWKKKENLNKLEVLAAHLRSDSKVGSVIALTDLFQGEIPKRQAQISESLFLFSMAEKNPLNSFMTENSKNTRLMIRFSDYRGDDLKVSREWIKASAQKLFPEVQIKESGMAIASHTINQSVAKDLVYTFWHPLLLIGLFLVVMFRSWRWALIACLPNAIPPLVLIGVMASTQVVIKPAVALVFAIALGFAFNNTIYILSRLREKKNLKAALLLEANPCMFESLVMFFGFAIFILSNFAVNKSFGTFMMISVLAGFLADLFFLPALISIVPKFLKVTKFESEKLVKVETPEGDSHHMRTAAIVIGFLMVVSSQHSKAKMSEEASQLLKKSQQQLDAKDDQAQVEMKIIEKNGEAKIRKLELKTLRHGDFSVIAKIISPADVKGMGFLGQVRDGDEAQWIFLPSSGQVRRVVTGKTKSGLLGSEISPEDLNSNAIKTANAKLLPFKGSSWVIEVVPQKGTSSYSAAISHLDKKTYLPLKVEYFVGKKVKKTVEFKDYKKFGNVFRAQKIDVKNHINGRRTEVRLSQIKVNTGLKEDDFTQAALKD